MVATWGIGTGGEGGGLVGTYGDGYAVVWVEGGDPRIRVDLWWWFLELSLGDSFAPPAKSEMGRSSTVGA